MTIRYYILPVETNGDYRGPKYLTIKIDSAVDDTHGTVSVYALMTG